MISVGNTDYSGLHACTCVAYMPQLPLTSEELSSDIGQRAKHELVQACAGAIIDVIENCAEKGFRCTLNTRYVTECGLCREGMSCEYVVGLCREGMS